MFNEISRIDKSEASCNESSPQGEPCKGSVKIPTVLSDFKLVRTIAGRELICEGDMRPTRV